MNRTIGERLKSKRLELNLTLEKVSSELKIRPEFLRALENDDYSVFASDLYAKGFIKNYSKFLGLDSDSFNAVYRRDIETTKLKTKTPKNINEEKEVKKNIYLNREKFKYLVFIVFGIAIVLAVLALVNKAFEPPMLQLFNPATIQAGGSYSADYYDKTVKITGKTVRNTVIKINGIVVPTNPDNTFESELFPITLDVNNFTVEAISNVGVISRATLTLNKKTNIIEQASGINGAIQISKDNSLIRITIDGNMSTNGIFFQDDSIPVIAKNTISIEADKPENVEINLNGNEYKITNQILKLKLVDNILVEDN